MLDAREGLGYALGWVSVGLVVASCASYSIRRRVSGFKFGAMPKWMSAHMILALAGLACAIVHAGGMGYGNSNMTMLLMLVVSASGLMGRYLKTRGGNMFNWWHAAHLPLVFLLFVCIIIHIIFSFLY